jgi:hypothetical protein
MNADQKILSTHVTPWAKRTMQEAHKAFIANPNATNWNAAIRAMFVHQQAEQAVRSVSVDHTSLTSLLARANVNTWGDLISMATINMTVSDALAEAAVINIATA